MSRLSICTEKYALKAFSLFCNDIRKSPVLYLLIKKEKANIPNFYLQVGMQSMEPDKKLCFHGMRRYLKFLTYCRVLSLDKQAVFF